MARLSNGFGGECGAAEWGYTEGSDWFDGLALVSGGRRCSRSRKAGAVTGVRVDERDVIEGFWACDWYVDGVRYKIPPVPTLPTIKFRPALISVAFSAFASFLEPFVDRCLSSSVLFLTRRREFDLFFPAAVGAELFLIWRRLRSGVGVFVPFLGLEAYCEVEGAMVVPGVVVIWEATAGSRVIRDTRVLREVSDTISARNQSESSRRRLRRT